LRARPDAEVVIVGADDTSYGPRAPGGGDWKSYCLNEILPDLDLSRVHFLDRQPHADFLTLTQISSAHVYLTYPFVLSWSLIEAMSAGCSIIASDTTPVREVIRNGENGVLVPFGDPGAIASAVADVLADPDRYAHLGVNARRTAVENYDTRLCVPKTLALLGITTDDAELDDSVLNAVPRKVASA